MASFVLLVTAERLQRSAWSFLAFGPLTLLGLVGMVLGDGAWIVVAAIVCGFSAAVTFVVTFALPSILKFRPMTCTAWRAACSPSATRSP